MKREWTKPQLIVISRGRPEERVLAACKTSGNSVGPALLNSQNDCRTGDVSSCATCQPQASGGS